MLRNPLVAGICAAGLLLLADSAVAETLRFSASLVSDVAGSAKTSGQGNAALSLDTATKTISWTVQYSGLASAPRALGCGALDTPAGPSVLVTSNLASPITGSKALTDAELAALRGGSWACVVDTDGEEDAIGGVMQPVP